MAYFAHSPNEKRCVSAQRYELHIENVKRLAKKFTDEISVYAKNDGEALKQTVALAAEYHDLGKLDKENQNILNGNKKAKRLPINHVDAGCAYFLKHDNCLVSALIQAHHIGYGDFIDLKSIGFRDKDSQTVKLVDEHLNDYLNIHKSLLNKESINIPQKIKGNRAIFFRLALSCLADADHTDSAIHYDEYPKKENRMELKAKERLESLNKYIEKLSEKSNINDDRLHLRKEMYNACRDSVITKDIGIVCCAAPVGSGKTTAIMAHLLKQASERNLRKIFVILPFTNIIQQSVKIYRDALVLENENPEDVIAELHHRTDFQNRDSRYLTALWHAPIIITTAVAFFETLASNTPATLRRLHELPGSAVFIDEAHAALPVKLLPLAWRWICRFTDEWNCYFLLASGSLVRFWEIENIKMGRNEPDNIPEIVNEDLRKKMSIFEKKRIEYKNDIKTKNCEELASWINSFEGPRLVIMNTVQSAATVADYFAKNFGRDKVEHLSTSLTPLDRDKVLARVKNRLKHSRKYEQQYISNSNWTLIATSCVEAGVDLSFRIGFREIGSTVSLLQTSGRINRNGEYETSEMWSFKIRDENLLKIHPMLKDSSAILNEYFEQQKEINPLLSTQSLNDEIILSGRTENSFKKLIYAEKYCRFPAVEREFKVIADDTRLVVIDKDLINKIKNFEKIDWRELQKKSVQIYGYKLNKLKITEIRDGLYEWNLEYNDFLGYMAGILCVAKVELGECSII